MIFEYRYLYTVFPHARWKHKQLFAESRSRTRVFFHEVFLGKFMNDVQASGEVSSTAERTSSPWKLEIYFLSSFLRSCFSLHCNKTLRRILPPRPNIAGPNEQGGGTFVRRPCWYFTFLHTRRHFRNFPEIYPVKKRMSVSGEESNSHPLGVLILFYTSSPWLPCMRAQNIKPYALLWHFRHGGMYKPAWARDTFPAWRNV